MAAQPPLGPRSWADAVVAQSHASMTGLPESVWPFRCEVTPDGDSVAIRLHGELDVATAPEVDAAFAEVAPRGVPVTVDLRGLTFMDSRGIRMLVSFQEQASAGGFPLQVACGDQVRELLAMTGLDRHVTVVQLPGD